jgi:hypothetical protein
MDEIIFYSTGCTRCSVLKRKLDSKNIVYIEKNDVDEMLSLGIKSAPTLKINEDLLKFEEAIKWVNNYHID